MIWFKKLVASWARQGSNYEEYEEEKPSREAMVGNSNMKSSKGATALRGCEDIDAFGEPVRFTLSKATGGFIISTRRYDNRADRTLGDNYIITNDQDLGAEISKIITLEALKF
jgi:hypothetical protein